MLATLGYDQKWLEYGFLDHATLQEQLERYATSDDRHTEHYRYRAFRAVLAQQLSFDPTFLERYIELADLDPDYTMGQAALIDLINHPALADDQLDLLRHHPQLQSAPVQTALRRKQMLRKLQKEELIDEQFAVCMASKDAIVQHTLLTLSTLTRDQIEALHTHGATRAVRNIAKQRLQHKQ